jgi:hypothetical protein
MLRADFVVDAHPPWAHAVPARCPFKGLEPCVELQRLTVLIWPEVQHYLQPLTGVSGMMRCSVARHGVDDAELKELAQKGRVVLADLLRQPLHLGKQGRPALGCRRCCRGRYPHGAVMP